MCFYDFVVDINIVCNGHSLNQLHFRCFIFLPDCRNVLLMWPNSVTLIQGPTQCMRFVAQSSS